MAVKTSTKKSAPKAAAPITITRPALAKGEVYVGAILGADGKGHHIILLPGDESGTWQAMLDAAKKRGGDLPSRIEQAMLFAGHKDKFKREWYWSNTPHASDPDYAWVQVFVYGSQYDYRKVNGYRARAVRRVAI